jgi:hypothetical protein
MWKAGNSEYSDGIENKQLVDFGGRSKRGNDEIAASWNVFRVRDFSLAIGNSQYR